MSKPVVDRPTANQPVPQRQLTVFDSACIIVGIIIGVGVYETAPTIAGAMPNAISVLAIWAVGGGLSLAGALCYAELATAYPRAGGDYVYLNRAYGSWAGYLFAWADFVIIRPGSLAAMVFPFATYAQTLCPPFNNPYWQAHAKVIFAAAAVVLLTAINILGVRHGKWTQNVLTSAKALGVLAIFFVALAASGRGAEAVPNVAHPLTLGGLNLALILVLFAYGGWNEIAYVAAEVKCPEKNILRSLVVGTTVVTLLYVMVNAAYLHVLGHAQMAASKAVATDTVAAVFPHLARGAIGALICISALGAANGMILAGARIAYAMGREHRLFGFLGQWSSRLGTPANALAVQGCIGVAIIMLAGSFNQVLLYTTPVVWTFFLCSGVSVFVLRHKEPWQPRPYRIHGHPFTTILFCASCLFLVYSAVDYNWSGTVIALGILLLGLPFYWLSKTQPGGR
jgi:APA family basic amino acid/polyamine antiporter